MRVGFMIIGAQKCGTTSLASQLAAHPDICFCRLKEPGYFHRTEDWEAGLEGYHALFSPLEGQLCGEASTMYTFLPEWQGTHSRLFAYNPSLKLIYVMRQPVERLLSNYGHDLVRGRVRGRPEAVVFEDPVYINRGRYGVQIRPYVELFGRENVLLLIFEEYVADQVRTLQDVARFLAISTGPFDDLAPAVEHQTVGEMYWRSSSVRGMVDSRLFDAVRAYMPAPVRHAVRGALSNRLEEKPEFSPELRREIWRFVEDDVCTIEGMLGRRLDVWRRAGAW